MNIKLWELGLVSGGALGLGLWQLYDVNKALREPPADDQQKAGERGGNETEAGGPGDQ